jgi:polyisoprenyl-phosphate glycosyltransferase
MYPSEVASVSLDVSVVLPCFNERDHIELELKRIRATLEGAGLAYELICVDDGSSDGTRELLEATPGIRTIVLPRNQGRARPGGSGPSRPPVGWWCGPTPI